MKITLKQLQLNYFKGAKNLTVDFSNRTDIRGKNESGKTRLVDAWCFLLFGKNSEDQKDFSIKCLDENNVPLHRVDHSVTGILSIDGMDTKFERIYKERWVKKRGEETAEFNGHETLFFVNGVPHQLKDYTEKVESILPESLFKQVTNPAFFNSMKWTDRRAMLFEMAGNVTDSDVITANKDLKKFYEAITGKSFDEFKRELAAKKKLLKESILNVPARIDEVSRAIVPDPDYVQIQVNIHDHNLRLIEIDGLIASDAEKFNSLNLKNQEVQNNIFEKQRTIDQLKNDDLRKSDKSVNDLKLRKNGLMSEIDWYKRNVVTLQNNLNSVTAKKHSLVSDNEILRDDWTTLNTTEFTFDDILGVCMSCHRQLETDDIETKKGQMLSNFNNDKSSKLQRITNQGQTNKKEIERLNDEVARIQDQINNENLALSEKQKESDNIIIPTEAPKIISNPQILILQDEIIKLEKAITTINKVDNTELITEKIEINMKLDFLKKQLNIEEQNKKLKVRKQELIDSEKSLSQQIADLEKQEFQCEAFTRAKIGMIEDKVNSMFSMVRFKMFNNLVNGGSEEVCEALIKGVPYQDANAAAKTQGGLDIIRTLSKHYDCYAPVFIDNRESVTEIPEMDCQVISLYVDPACKELKIINN